MYIKKVKYWNHSNKTKFVLVEDKNSPLISIDIWCKAGISFERKDNEGVAHFLEHMIFKGSNKLDPGEFDYKIESLGGSSNASTGYDDSHYYVLIPPENFEESFLLLTNLVLNPDININEFELEQNVVIEEIKQQNDQPEELLYNYFLKRVWKNHFYGKSILGREEYINQIKVFDLINFHSERYLPDNICIALAGNLPDNTLKILENANFSYKNNLNHQSKNNHNYNYSIRTGRERVFFRKLKLSRLIMAWQVPASKDQKSIIGLEILASLLVDGRNSKLGKPLKEEQSLVESIYLDLNTGEFGSLMILEACCLNKNLNLVEEIINDVLKNLVDFESYSRDELKKAHKIVKSNYYFNLETASQQSSYFGNHFLWGRKYPIKDLEKNLKFWDNKKNFKNIIKLLANKKYTLLAHG